ncbi:MAG TPA: sodium:solute symporter family protein [Candidatus Kapabacteria bacterium]|nr:sodium:solute symporter family protein [Candidatus Kapabacteria bacterium]
MKLGLIDIIVIAVYFLAMVIIGLYVSKKTSGTKKDDFLLAGRKLSLPLFVASLVATWYGSILGVGEFVYNSGVVAWISFGLPYYIAAALFGGFLAGKIRDMGFSSIPEQLEYYYGRKAGIISAIIILLITIPSAYILMLGVIIQLFSGWELWISIIFGTILSLVYLFTGGFRADIYTNSAQFILMFVGFILLFIFSYHHFGFVDENLARLPSKHLSPLGGLSWQYVLSWYIIAFQTFVDPSFHQRCAAARSPKIARNGVFISILFWALFDFLTLSAGLYAKARLPEIEPMMAFPLLGELVLPPFVKGIFVVSMLATIMSTLNSYSFISGVTIGRDLLHKYLKGSEEFKIRIGLLISSIMAIILAISIPSAVDLIYKTSSIAIPGLIIPLTLTYFNSKLLNSKDSITILISTTIIALIFSIYKNDLIKVGFDFEPMFPAIIFAGILSIILIYKNKK